jgi:hypothetical protein
VILITNKIEDITNQLDYKQRINLVHGNSNLCLLSSIIGLGY